MLYITCVLYNSCVLYSHTVSGLGSRPSVKGCHSEYVWFCLLEQLFSLGKCCFKLLGLLVHSAPMSSTQQRHMSQGEPMRGLHCFVQKDWFRDGHVTQAKLLGILGQDVSYCSKWKSVLPCLITKL